LQVTLAYGRNGLLVEVPPGATVIRPISPPGLLDEREAFRRRIAGPIGSRPLQEIVSTQDRVVIVISDRTRPVPNERLVPWILEELSNVPRENFLILNGTGTHRPNSREEFAEMLGDEVVDSVDVLNHDGYSRTELRRLGLSDRGHQVSLNKHYLDADISIVVGFIEPHFFAGFSGGPKGICPGVAGVETIKQLHSADLIGDPRSTWGVLDENPIHEGVSAAVRMAPPDFMINVTLNDSREITGIFAGDVFEAHRLGCRYCAEAATIGVDREFDIVLTTNGGFPLDQNLYQTVKGLSAAARIVKQGGTIVAASECSDGLPSHGRYAELLDMKDSPKELLEMIQGFPETSLDQWQVQIQAQIQEKAEVLLYSLLPPEDVSRAKLSPIPSVQEGLSIATARHGEDASVAVLPEGPLSAPFISDPDLT
jgi:nickel-dependent lactate racemase